MVYLGARNGKVDTKGWLEKTDASAADLTMRMIALGVKRFLYTDISRDGAVISFDCEGVTTMVRTTRKAILTTGGVSCMAELKQLQGT